MRRDGKARSGVEAAPRCGAASLIDKSIYAYISVFISNIT
jgi:hypothetical protein